MNQISSDSQRVVFGPSWSWIVLQAAASTVVGVGSVILIRTQMPDFSPGLLPIVAAALAVLVLRLFDRPVLMIDRQSGTSTLVSGWVPLLRKRNVFKRNELADVVVERTGADEGNPSRAVLLAASGAGHVLSSGQDLETEVLAAKIRNAIFRAEPNMNAREASE